MFGLFFAMFYDCFLTSGFEKGFTQVGFGVIPMPSTFFGDDCQGLFMIHMYV